MNRATRGIIDSIVESDRASYRRLWFGLDPAKGKDECGTFLVTRCMREMHEGVPIKPETATEVMYNERCGAAGRYLLSQFRKVPYSLFKLGGRMMPDPAGPFDAVEDTAINLPQVKVEFTLPTFKSKDLKTVRPKAELSVSADNCVAVVIAVGGKEYIVSHKQFLRAAKVIIEEFC